MIKPLRMPRKIREMRKQGALFVINHSGGKDSQAMTLRLRASGIPDDQIVIIHATLGDIEWPGTLAHIKATTAPLPLIIAEAKTDFFTMVRRRQKFPSPSIRQCTSDLKRGPIEREIRRYLKAHPKYEGRIVSCMGMRADESQERARRRALTVNTRQSIAGRDWINWLPIHCMAETEVFETIAAAGEGPHWAYDQGMSRVSCSFCIMSSRANLCTAARLRPDLFAKYAALEDEIGHTLSPTGRRLSELVTTRIP